MRKKICRGSLITLIASIAVMQVHAQMPDWDEIEIKTTDIGDGIYTLAGMGGTIGVSVGEDGVFLIDDQFQPLADKILAAIADITDKPIRFVVNTHWHGDHRGSNAEMAAAGGLLVAHDNVRVRMAAEGPQQAAPEALPVVTFSDSVTFHFNGHEIAVLHPIDAHTDGDAVVHFVEIDVIHAGDILFNGIYPFIDLDSGGTIEGFLHAMEVIESMAGPDTRIIAGHGDASATDDDMRKNIAMLKTTRDRVQALIDEGKTLDEVKAANPLSDYNDEWSWPFINGDTFTEILYRGLSAE